MIRSRVWLALVMMSLVLITVSPAMVEAQEGQVTDLGVPLHSVGILGAGYGPGLDGQEWMYPVSSGDPAIFNVIDSHTGDRVASFPLEGAGGAWGVTVAPDGTVYIGTYSNAHLYRWVPGSDHVDDLGAPIAGQTFIWRLATDAEGRVYGGTYPGGRVFQYDPATNSFRDYGQMVDGEQYARSIAVAKGKVYVGIGAHAHLIELDPVSGAKHEIPLPEYETDQTFVYDLNYEGNLLFVRLTNSKDLLVYNVITGQWVDRITSAAGLDVSSRGPDNKVYFVRRGRLSSYDLRTMELTSTDLRTGLRRGFGWIHLDTPDYPGPSLVSLRYQGDFWIYNPKTGNYKTIQAQIDGQPVPIQSIGEGPDGNIYVGGYVSGGLGRYNPSTGKLQEYKGIGQIEGMKAYGNMLYMGVYPGAYVYSYDPAQAYDAGTNPRRLFSLRSYGQDRPFAFTPAGDELAIGTVPEYGELGGALTLYDPGSNTHQVYRNVVQNQSVVSLTYKDGLIYGGTSISGGLGIDPTETEAKLFIRDPATKQKVYEGVPVPGEKAIYGLTFDAQGDLWGLTAGGYIFEFDPGTRQVIQSKQLFPSVASDHYWRDGFLTYDQDGYLYGVLLGRLFRVDPQTLGAEVLVNNAHLFAEGPNGDFYFARGAELYKYDR